MAIIIPSPLGTPSRSVPLVASSELGKFAGLPMVFQTVAALVTAANSERQNVIDGTPIWPDTQPVGVAAEVAVGVWRMWRTPLQHARTVVTGTGVTALLGAETNSVVVSSGVPSGATGNVGDIVINPSTNSYYTKTAASTWSAPSTLSGASAPPFTAADAKDATAAALAAGTHSGVTVVYDSVAKAISLSAAAGGGVSIDALNVLTVGTDNLPYLPNAIDGGGANTAF